MTHDKERLLQGVGEKIRKTRLHHDKTTKEVASRLQITTQAYGNMERGRCDICISRLFQLADVYKVPVVTFMPDI